MRRKLDRLVGDDVGRRRYIEALLSADREDSGWLEPPPPEPPPTADVLLAGGHVGSWTLVAPLGEGGMGEVWHVRRREDGFAQEAALKVVKRGLVTESVLARFSRERKLLAALEHPGIARLIDGGTTPDGRPFLAMELVRGTRIDQWAEHRALGTEARLQLFVEVLDIVQAAHQRLVIHRDLKPSNILIDAEGRPRLLDFGIAKMLGDDEHPTVTIEGAAPLTPRYASPEQLTGAEQSVQSDVYSAGVVLYELLTGTRFTRDGTTSGSRAADSAKATTTAPKLRGDLANIVHVATHHESTRRYPTAAAFRDDLVRFVERKPVRARPDSLGYRTLRFAQRHAVFLALAAVALGVTGTASVSAFLSAESEAMARAEADRNAATAQWTAYQNAVSGAAMASHVGQGSDALRLLESAPENHRGWEWRMLANELRRGVSSAPLDTYSVGPLCGQILSEDGKHLILGHGSGGGSLHRKVQDTWHRVALPFSFCVLALSDDARTAFGANARTIWRRSFPEGRESYRVARPPAADNRRTFFDPTRIAKDEASGCFYIGDRSGELFCHAIETGDLLWRARPHPRKEHVPEITGLHILKKRGLVVTASCDRTIAFTDASTGEVRRKIETGHESWIGSLDVTSCERFLVTASYDGTVRAFDFETGRESRRIASLPRRVSVAVLSPGDDRIAVGDSLGQIHVFDRNSGRLLVQFPGSGAQIVGLDWLDEQRIIAVDQEKRARTFDLLDAPKKLFKTCLFPASLSFSPGGERFAYHTPDGFLHIHEKATGNEIQTIEVVPIADGMWWRANGRDLAIVGANGLLQVWRIDEALLLHQVQLEVDLERGDSSLRFLGGGFWPDADTLTLACGQRGWQQVDLRSGHVRSIQSPEKDNFVNAVSFAWPGRILVGCNFLSSAPTIRSTPRRLLSVHPNGIVRIRPHPNLRRAALLTDQNVVIFDVERESAVTTLDTSSGSTCVAWHPTEPRLLIGGHDGGIRVFETNEWKLITSLPGHSTAIKDIAFSPDGGVFVSSSSDGLVIVTRMKQP